MQGSREILNELRYLIGTVWQDYLKPHTPENKGVSCLVRDRASSQHIGKSSLPAIILSLGNIAPSTEYPNDNPILNATMKVLIAYMFEEKDEDKAVYYGAEMVDALMGLLAHNQTIDDRCISAKVDEGYIGMFTEGAVRTIYMSVNIIYRVPPPTTTGW